MKKILYTLLAGSLFMTACGDNNPVGDPIEITRDRYTLPEHGASQWANDYIVALHDESGSYITYHPTQADFTWTYGPAPTEPSRDSIAAGDPQYVEPLLRFIDSIWIGSLTAEGKRGNMLPYRILLADSIWTWDERTGDPVNIPAKVTGRSIAFGGVNAKFGEMTTAQKDALVQSFTTAIWTDYYDANDMIPFPEKEFHAVTDWDALRAAFIAAGYDMARQDAVRFDAGVMYRRNWQVVRPGIPHTYGWRMVSWYTQYWTYPNSGVYVQNNDMCMRYDREVYLNLLFYATDAEMQTYLDNYPNIKKKWDLLVDWYKNEVGFDPRPMANGKTR